MPRGLTALNRGRKKADEGAKPGSTRESRQFSQLSDLHPCSSFTGRLLRQTRKGWRRNREDCFGVGWDTLGILGFLRRTILDFLARVCVPVSTRTPSNRLQPNDSSAWGSSRFATRANRLKVWSRQCECRDPAFVKTMPRSLVSRDLVRRLLRLGWRRNVLLNPSNLLSLCLVYRRWNFESFVVCFRRSSRSMSWDLWKIMLLWVVVLEFVVVRSE